MLFDTHFPFPGPLPGAGRGNHGHVRPLLRRLVKHPEEFGGSLKAVTKSEACPDPQASAPDDRSLKLAGSSPQWVAWLSTPVGLLDFPAVRAGAGDRHFHEAGRAHVAAAVLHGPRASTQTRAGSPHMSGRQVNCASARPTRDRAGGRACCHGHRGRNACIRRDDDVEEDHE